MNRLFDIDRARQLMVKHGIDALISSSTDNFGYLTGYFTHYGRYFDIGWMGDPCLSAAALPKERDVEPFLLTSWSPYDVQHVDPWMKDRRYYVSPEYETGEKRSFFEVLSKTIKEKGLDRSRLGLEIGHASYTSEIASSQMVESLRRFLPDAEIRDASGLLRDMRLVKTDEEIERIKKSNGVISRAIEGSFEELVEGLTKSELEGIVRRELLEERVDVALININFGQEDLLRPTDRKLKKGDFVRIDLASKYEGYYADIARSVVFREPSDKLEKAYVAIQRAHDATTDCVETGVVCSRIFDVAKESLRDSGFIYQHPLVGHGVGLCVHEEPYLSDSKTIIQTGMTFTVEILLGFGKESYVGIEDMIVCDKKGCHDITPLHKDLVII